MFPTRVGSLPGRKVWLCFVLALALLLSQGVFLSQAQGFGYVFLSVYGNARESNPYSGARLKVSRLLIDMPHNSKSFKLCFTGSATPGTDFEVRGVALDGSGCFTDSWRTGGWLEGAERTYYIVGKRDNVRDPNETITATVSSVNWPSGYSLFGSYGSASFKIYGD